MRPSISLPAITLILLLAFACSSTGGSNGGGTSGSGEGTPDLPDNVAAVGGQRIRVEWKNLNPARKDPAIGLINNSSPEMTEYYKGSRTLRHIKPVDDKTMAIILQAFREAGFFEHATEGKTLDSCRMGDGHGAVYLRQGDKHYCLLFTRGQYGTGLPEAYRNSKLIIIEFHRRTLWLSPSEIRPDERIFELKPSKYSTRR